MIIAYNGPKNTIRKLGGIVWSVQEGWDQDVTDPDLLEDLLTYPGSQFSPDPRDPMVKAIGLEAAVKVGLSGVATVVTLADLNDQEIAALAEAAEVEVDVAAGWVDMTRAAAVDNE
jgi:hypothetical protein